MIDSLSYVYHINFFTQIILDDKNILFDESLNKNDYTIKNKTKCGCREIPVTYIGEFPNMGKSLYGRTGKSGPLIIHFSLFNLNFF